MDTSQALIFHRIVSLPTFDQLCSLWQRLATEIGREALLVTEAKFAKENQNNNNQETTNKFRLLLSPHLSLFLSAQLASPGLFYQINLTWDRGKIEDFLTKQGLSDIADYWIKLKPKGENHELDSLNYHLLNRFLINVLEILCLEEIVPANFYSLDNCPNQVSLSQQLEQERLLNQVIQQIRQSLELPIVLETAVREVRSFLQVDRLLIYQFISEKTKSNGQYGMKYGVGKITYESRSSLTIPSLLELIPEDDCFSYVPQYHEKYRRGIIVAIDDVETYYSSSFCLAEFLRKNSVLSKIIAPIVVKDKLWGLVIAHQCLKKRKWHPRERDFLGKIGEHLGIAIQQTQLYTEVREQKKNFEKRVIERTQELQDTLIAAQTANQYKNEFLSNISHELLTPLTCIIGLSGTLLHWTDKEMNLPLEKQIKYIKTIQDNGKTLLHLINDILDYSSFTAGNNELNLKDFSLYTMTSTLIDYFQEDARQKQIQLNLEFQIQKDQDKFYADSRRVQQIISQLLKNAIKFTPEGGKVVLRLWRENEQLFFQVEDTGIGISQEEFPLLFENFKQLEKPRNRTYGGTGLGLALTKQLVELHRGTIEVESIPQQGSIFTVRLPNQLKSPLQKNEKNSNSSSQNNLNRTLVIISQDEENSILICELLTINNYQVVWLIDDCPSLKQIEVLQPKIIIVDEGQNSQVYNLTKELKQNLKKQSFKILILKKSLQSLNWLSLSENGIDDYLLKPIEPTQLLQKVELLRSLS